MSKFKQISNAEDYEDAKKQFKEGVERKNPCRKEQELSLKCLDDYFYDRDKCATYFENYRFCKAFWGFVSKQRRAKGIQPLIPPAEEREEIKKEYLPQFRY